MMMSGAVLIDQVSPTTADAHYCLSRYFQELSERFDGGFDLELDDEASLDEFVPPNGCFLVMRLEGELVGCGGFKPLPPDAVYVKRMWISLNARGLGFGKRLLAALEEHARSAGYRKVRLETNRSLTEAQQLYRKCGYREIPPFNDEFYAHHWFEKILD